jgi:lipoyl-dependent peroxiredoxin
MTTPAIKSEKVLHTAKVHLTGGHEHFESHNSDDHLNIKHSWLGSPGIGTNPEQLLAADWSACFELAMGLAALNRRITLPADTAIDVEVDLCGTDGTYFRRARLNVSLPGLEHDVAQALVDTADETCPYFKPTRYNVDATIHLV